MEKRVYITIQHREIKKWKMEQEKIETSPLSRLQLLHNESIYNFSFIKWINYSWV